MSKRSCTARRCLFLLVTGVLSTLVLGGIPSASRAMEPVRSGVDKPVREENPYYQRLAKLPIQSRRAEFTKLSANQQSAVWRAHLRSYLESHSELNTEQRALLDQAIALAQPSFFRASHGKTKKLPPQVEELISRFRRAFGDAEAAALLLMLGPAEDRSSSPATENRKSGGTCDCQARSWRNVCIWFRNEICLETACIPLYKGCGLFWQEGCDGICTKTWAGDGC